jgi:hypothetical protein
MFDAGNPVRDGVRRVQSGPPADSYQGIGFIRADSVSPSLFRAHEAQLFQCLLHSGSYALPAHTRIILGIFGTAEAMPRYDS